MTIGREVMPVGAIVVDHQPRCARCNKLVARLLTRPWVLDCPRCKHHNEAH